MKNELGAKEWKMFRELLILIDAWKDNGVLVLNFERDLLISQMDYICHRYRNGRDVAIYRYNGVYYKSECEEQERLHFRFTALKAWKYKREYDPTWYFEDTRPCFKEEMPESDSGAMDEEDAE